jgi:hypothetical protein
MNIEQGFTIYDLRSIFDVVRPIKNSYSLPADRVGSAGLFLNQYC